MDQNIVVEQIAALVKEKFEKESSGHDWWHIWRVWQMAKKLAAAEGGNLFIVELGALLHDIADWKFHDGDFTAGSKAARELLARYNLPGATLDHICEIIDNVSFRGAGVKDNMPTLEGQIVQDADRLEAIGAIGVARCFAWSGHMNLPIHVPGSKPGIHKTKEDYTKGDADEGLNHFYEKMLLLKDRMHTETAKKLASGRHKFTENYLTRFLAEWDGKM